MSTEQITGEQGRDYLYREVYLPVFFGKLASDYGVKPRNEEESGRLIKMAADLRSIHEQELVKAASTGSDFLGLAENRLQAVMQSRGLNSGKEEARIKQAAATIMDNPTVQAHVLAYQNAVAAQYTGANAPAAA